MGLCVLYYIEYSLYNVKKEGFFLPGLELHFKFISKALADEFDLILSQTTNFRLFQTDRVCKHQFQV